ncbi:MAG: hypothetical protein IKB41_01715 [Clostridia bacterium]|nr:hypothetical protein [Clostridia bacterium]
MFRYNSVSKHLFIAGLVILLCLVCLTGATLALFVSAPTDGTIGIITTSGNVRVDIVDATSKVSLVGQVLQLQTSSERREILFEPGATYFTQGFKVKNTGDIPINFRLSVSDDEGIDMDEFYEAFEVWIAKDNPDLSNAERLTDFRGSLKVGECSESTYYLFIKMKEDVGNEFKGKIYTGVGVTVYAVQGNAEMKE